jgi:hypothetical protein
MDGMHLGVSEVLKASPIRHAAQYVRAFYHLLSDRREYQRAPISGTVRLTYSGYVVESAYVCSCVDISPRGMAVDCPDSIPQDTLIMVHAEEQDPRRPARVCYCHERGTVYRIGLEFTAGDAKGISA